MQGFRNGWKGEGESRTGARFGLDVDCSSGLFDKVIAEHEANADAAFLFGAFGAEMGRDIEQLLDLFTCHADAGILHKHLGSAFILNS